MQKCDIYFAVSAIAWIVTVIGWFVSNYHSNNREARKEVRSSIDQLIDELEKLSKSTNTYYCSTNEVEQSIACAEIYSSFERLSGLSQRLENNHSDIHIQLKIDDLYELVTGDDFGSVNLVRNSTSYISKSKLINLKTETIRTEAENWFTYTFKP